MGRCSLARGQKAQAPPPTRKPRARALIRSRKLSRTRARRHSRKRGCNSKGGSILMFFTQARVQLQGAAPEKEEAMQRALR